MYGVLKDELLKPHTLDSLEQRANEALQAAFPKRLEQRRQRIAIDLVLISYYGEEATHPTFPGQEEHHEVLLLRHGRERALSGL